jgi:hypothetical protein
MAKGKHYAVSNCACARIAIHHSQSAIGGARCNVRFDITVIVNAADNQAALANLEALIFSVTDLLSNNISFLGGWSQPTVQQIGNADMLISQLNIEMVTTN